MGILFKALERISPTFTAKIAFDFISNPKVKKYREFEQPILDKAHLEMMEFKGAKIAKYKWGSGSKKVLLVHGWEGRAANFGALIPVLMDAGYEVISFDGLSHGNSEKTKASFFDYSDLIKVFLQLDSYDLILTHSIGSVMTLFAINELKIPVKQLFIITTPNRFEQYMQNTLNRFGLTNRTKEKLIELIKSTSGRNTTDLNAVDFVKSIKVKRAVFIHDVNDQIIHISVSPRASTSFLVLNWM